MGGSGWQQFPSGIRETSIACARHTQAIFASMHRFQWRLPDHAGHCTPSPTGTKQDHTQNSRIVTFAVQYPISKEKLVRRAAPAATVMVWP